jgi:hypothetical protein
MCFSSLSPALRTFAALKEIRIMLGGKPFFALKRFHYVGRLRTPLAQIGRLGAWQDGKRRRRDWKKKGK